MRPHAAVALAVTAFAGGCANLPTGTDDRTLAERRTTLESIEAWEMRGRLTIDTGERAVQGRFNWRQDGELIELTVRNPLGAGILQVEGPPNALSVTARGERRTLTDPETELSELIGWWLPVSSLPNWLLGFPDRAYRASTQPGADGTLASFEQRLWNVAYASYGLASLAPSGAQALVPSRIVLTHDDLTLQLTVDDWRPTTAAAP